MNTNTSLSSKTKTQKEELIEKLKSEGFKRYSEKEYPEGNGQMVIIFRGRCPHLQWAQTTVMKKHWNDWKKTSDLGDREFYWNPE